jgi:hypothetical protein
LTVPNPRNLGFALELSAPRYFHDVEHARRAVRWNAATFVSDDGELLADPEQGGGGYGKAVYVEPWLFRACFRQGGKPGDCSDDANMHPVR